MEHRRKAKDFIRSGVRRIVSDSRKHGIYPATCFSRQKKLREYGEVGLSPRKRRREDGYYIQKIEDEVSLLKEY